MSKSVLALIARQHLMPIVNRITSWRGGFVFAEQLNYSLDLYPQHRTDNTLGISTGVTVEAFLFLCMTGHQIIIPPR